MAKAAFLGDVGKIIAKHYQANKEAKGKEILDLVNADSDMKGRKISLSTVQTKLSEWHKEEKAQIAAGMPTDPLDKSWNIGSCEEHGISADMIPVLLQMQQLAQKLQKRITIRQAQWFARLYPSVKQLTTRKWKDIIRSISGFTSFLLLSLKEQNEELSNELLTTFKGLLELKITNDSKIEDKELEFLTLLMLAVIGVQYAKEEQISKLLNKESTDTSELDSLIFIQEEISAAMLMDGFLSAVTPVEQEKDKAKLRASFKGLSESDLEVVEKRFGRKLTQKQIDILNSFGQVFLTRFANIEQWVKQHPDEWAELKVLEVEANERTY